MKRFVRLMLGVTVAAGNLLFSTDAARAYEPGDEMCTARAQGTPAGVNARCMDGPDDVIAAIGVTNFHEGGSEVTFGVWNRLSEKQEKCNGTVVCWADVGSKPMEQYELPRYETTVTKVDVGGAISWVDHFICMCI
jgi:hypothetical protein